MTIRLREKAGFLLSFIKNASFDYKKMMLGLFNNILEYGMVPSAFTRSIIFPIHKKGDISDVSNYCGISFMDVLAKVFIGILLQRLIKWELGKKVIVEKETGFRKAYSAVHNIFLLYSIVKYYLSVKGKKIYCFFVDLRAAFDSIGRDVLFFKLYELGISHKFINILKGLYCNTCSSVWCKGGLMQDFVINSGVKQGCLMSPNLYSLFTYDLCEWLGGGISIGNLKINVLLYADDVVILSDNVVLFQNMINNYTLIVTDGI